MILNARPRSDEGDTYYGLPFVNGSGDYTEIIPSAAFVADDDEAATPGLIRYAPLPIRAPITITGLLFLLQSGPSVGPSNLRAAILAADEDWQPTGAPLLEKTFEVGSEISNEPIEPVLASTVTLEAGMYLMAVEDDGAEGYESLSVYGHFASFPGSFFLAPDAAPFSVEGLGTQLPCFVAEHAYGGIGSDPPRWSQTDFQLVAIGAGGNAYGSFFYPFFLKWEAA